MADLNFSIDNEQVRELFKDAIREEAIKACKHALADNDIRLMIREAFSKSYGSKSVMQNAIEQTVSSSVSSAVWNLFEEPEIKETLRSIIKAEIESKTFTEMIKEAVYKSVWSSSIKINPDGLVQNQYA